MYRRKVPQVAYACALMVVVMCVFILRSVTLVIEGVVLQSRRRGSDLHRRNAGDLFRCYGARDGEAVPMWGSLLCQKPVS